MNCKAINDSIHCIKLASEVLYNNFVLCFQPMYNILFKLFFLAFFSIVILTAISTSEFSKVDFKFTVPATSNSETP